MKVVILCGGKGARLREETEFRPKPMVPIGRLPILWHIMKYYAHHGHSDFILCLGYKGDMIKDFFRNYLWNTCDVTLSLGRESVHEYHDRHAEEHWRVTLADTGAEAMTAFRLRMVRRYIPKGERFLFTYGDGLSDIDIPSLIRCHEESGKLCTISAVHPAGRFGSLIVQDDGSISTFQEKPQLDEQLVNGGFMVCEYGVFDYLPDDPSTMFERDPIMRIAADGQLNAFKHEGWWQPMDTYQEMQHLNGLWESGAAPWKLW